MQHLLHSQWDWNPQAKAYAGTFKLSETGTMRAHVNYRGKRSTQAETVIRIARKSFAMRTEPTTPSESGAVLLHENPASNGCPVVMINGLAADQVAKSDPMIHCMKFADLFRGTVEVELLSAYGNSEIRYTLSGNSPTNKSLLYTKPLTVTRNLLDGNTVIKARIYDKMNSNKKGRGFKIKFRIAPSRSF